MRTNQVQLGEPELIEPTRVLAHVRSSLPDELFESIRRRAVEGRLHQQALHHTVA